MAYEHQKILTTDCNLEMDFEFDEWTFLVCVSDSKDFYPTSVLGITQLFRKTCNLHFEPTLSRPAKIFGPVSHDSVFHHLVCVDFIFVHFGTKSLPVSKYLL